MAFTVNNPLTLDTRSFDIRQARQQAYEQFQSHGLPTNGTINLIDGRNLDPRQSSAWAFYLNCAPPFATEISVLEIICGYMGASHIKTGTLPVGYTDARDADGNVIAYLNAENKLVFIPFDVTEFGTHANDVFGIAAAIVAQKAAYLQNMQFTWSPDTRASLIEQFKKAAQDMDSDSIDRLERKLRDQQEREQTYRQELQAAMRNIRSIMEKLDLARKNGSDLHDKIAHEFDYIAKNPDIERLVFKENKITFYTKQIIGDVDGTLYNFGKFRVTFDIQSTDVRMYGDTKRAGYWTSEDPHPHVDGNGGRPCLGNVSEAVVQLASIHEYAALASVLIEFLRTANPSDPAGRNYIRWDVVDEQGEIIMEGTPPVEQAECQACGEDFNEDEMYTVYNHADGDIYTGERLVCDDCRTEYYTYSEYHEVYIHDDNPSEAFNGPAEEDDDDEDDAPWEDESAEEAAF